MQASIYKLFDLNRQILIFIDLIVYYLRIQNYDSAIRTINGQISLMSQFMNILPESKDYFEDKNISVHQDEFMTILSELLHAQERKDYVLLADLYEVTLKPVLLTIQEAVIITEGLFVDNDRYQESIKAIKYKNAELGLLISKVPKPEEIEAQDFTVEFTSYGDYTLALKNQTDTYYFHSNINVWQEALYLAKSWYSPDKSNYVIYGLGLGYHAIELALIDEYVHIEIYESDINVIRLACVYAPIKAMLELYQIDLIYDPDHSLLMERISIMDNDTEFVIHYPSLRNEKNEAVKNRLENYFLQYSSVINQSHILKGNFKENIKNYDGLADELQEEFKNKNLFIVAAGPSLDKNYLQLKEISKKDIILTTGTVLRKLLKAGIRPDYFIVTDANARVYAQVAGLEQEDIPMIYLSTAYKGFAQKYQGKKYMICQKGFDRAEEYAGKRNAMLIQTGGSVSTTALDLGIAFGCKRIIFLGLDLAYTGNYIHATDSSSRKVVSSEGLQQVEDVYGEKVFTNNSFTMYRQWIENRIRGVDTIEFIDATEGGARINGMKIMTMQECIENYSSIAD